MLRRIRFGLCAVTLRKPDYAAAQPTRPAECRCVHPTRKCDNAKKGVREKFPHTPFLLWQRIND